MSGAPRIPEATATPAPPAARTSSISSGRMPPIATHGVPLGHIDDGAKPRHPDGVSGVRFRRGNPPRSHSPIVGSRAAGGFPERAHRCPDQKARRCDPTGLGHRKVIRPEVDPCGSHRESHVQPIVDQNRNIQTGDEPSRQSGKLPRCGVLEAKLNAGGTATNGRPGELGEIAPRDHRIISHQHEAQHQR